MQLVLHARILVSEHSFHHGYQAHQRHPERRRGLSGTAHFGVDADTAVSVLCTAKERMGPVAGKGANQRTVAPAADEDAERRAASDTALDGAGRQREPKEAEAYSHLHRA